MAILDSNWTLVSGYESDVDVIQEKTGSDGETMQNVLSASQGDQTFLLSGSLGNGMERTFSAEVDVLFENSFSGLNKGFANEITGSEPGILFGVSDSSYENGVLYTPVDGNTGGLILGGGDVRTDYEGEYIESGNIPNAPAQGKWVTHKYELWFPDPNTLSFNGWTKPAGAQDSEYEQFADRYNAHNLLSGVDDLSEVLYSGLGFRTHPDVYYSSISLGV